jgi:hypothetical protein
MANRRTSGGRGLLWLRNPELSDIVWEYVGQAIDVVAALIIAPANAVGTSLLKIPV